MIGEPSYNPLVSVIIPNYNHASFLKERIDSVLNQRFNDFEVIIIDDCSTDNSRSIIESYRGHEKISHLVFNDSNSGSPFAQWQKGLSYANGSWIWFAESDDVAELDFLEQMVTGFEDHDLVFCKSYTIDRYGNEVNYLGESSFPSEKILPIKSSLQSLDSNWFLENHMYRFNHIVNASSVCIRKKLLEKLLPNILSFSLCGDWMLWVLALKSGKAAYLPLGLNYFRVHSDTVRANSEGNLSIFYENLSIAALIYRDKPTKELKRKISGYLNYIYFHRYNAKLRKGDFFQFLSKIKFLGLSACIEALKNKTIYG